MAKRANMSGSMIRGTVISHRLDELGWSQAKLAREAGCSQPTILAIVSGKQRRSRLVPKIAQVLGITPGLIDPEYAVPDNVTQGDGGGTPTVQAPPHRITKNVAIALRILRPDIAEEAAQALASVVLSLAEVSLDQIEASEDQQLQLLLRGAVQAILRTPR